MAKLLPSQIAPISKHICGAAKFAKIASRATVTIAAEKDFASAKPLEEIPGFKALPFIGTSWVFYPIVGKYDPLKIYEYDFDKHKLFGDIARDKFGSGTLVNLFNEKDIEIMLRYESKFPVRGFLSTLQKYREMRKEWFKTTGVLLINGQEWYDLRFKLQRHLMRPQTMDKYLDPTTDISRECIKRISEDRNEKNEIENMMDYLTKFSLETVAFVGLDQRFGCLNRNLDPDSDTQKMMDAVKDSFHCMSLMEAIGGSSIQLWKYFPTPMWKKFVKAMDTFSRISFQRVQESMESLKSKGSEIQELTILQEMLTSKDIEPHEAMTMAIDMLMGGVDTASNALGFLLYDLATNPEKQEILYQEIQRFLPTPESKITPEILAEMRYLKMCLKESLRLHPVARMLVRMLPRDLVFSGYLVPAGTMIAAMMQVLGRQERYFKNPDSFIPERWEKPNKPSPFLHLPFGFGTRSCIGRRIAEIEAWIFIAEIIRNFRVEFRQESLNTTIRMALVVDPPLRLAFIDRK